MPREEKGKFGVGVVEGRGGEGESRQGFAKMELMVKIEMTVWT